MSLDGKQISRYRILRLLGSGGMGDVYLAEDARINQQVAIKVIHTEINSHSDEHSAKEAARLFQREARAIVKLDHPNILPLYDYGEELIANVPTIYLVMPYRSEGSLADWLRRRGRSDVLSPQDVAHIVYQAADALQHAHNRQVIHQDVKPSNFLIRNRKGTPARPDLLLTDFGIARLSSATVSKSLSVYGTPSYMAPEQWESAPVPATDQYALAVMTYELLTGRLPFQGSPGKMMYQHFNVLPQPPSAVHPHLSGEVDAILLHALAKAPENRFASILAFANAFHLAVEGVQSVQEAHSNLLPTPEAWQRVTLPAAMVQINTVAPTIPHSVTQPVGSDSETYVKPVGKPISLTDLVQLTPEATRNTSHRKGGWRRVLIVALIVFILGLVGGGMAYILPGLFSGLSGKAVVTIISTSQDVENTYTISAVTGIPDASKLQVGARFPSATTQAQSQITNATGTVNIPATHATGILTIDNSTAFPITFNVGTVFTNILSPHVQVMLDATVTVPQVPGVGSAGSATVPAHVVQVGSIGNLPVTNDNNYTGFQDYYPPDSGNQWDVINLVPFTGGQDPKTYTAVQQSDIDSVAKQLEKTHTPTSQEAMQMIQPLIHANERLISPPQCKPDVTADHNAGSEATTVTVTVYFTCTGEAYDYDGALSLATQQLKNQAMADPGNGYALVGDIRTNLISAKLANARRGTITLIVNAEGLWVYQFTNAQKQALVKLITGKRKSEARTLLLAQSGVKQVDVQFSGDTLPADTSHITIVVK